MFYYASHLGGWYAEEVEIPEDDLYCETCGDGDMIIGFFETEEEFLKEYKNLVI